MHRLLLAVTPIALVGLLAPFTHVHTAFGDAARTVAATAAEQRPVKIDDGRIGLAYRSAGSWTRMARILLLSGWCMGSTSGSLPSRAWSTLRSFPG